MGASRGKKKSRASSVFGKENERPDPKKGVVGRLSAGTGLWHVPCGPSFGTKRAEAPSLWDPGIRSGGATPRLPSLH